MNSLITSNHIHPYTVRGATINDITKESKTYLKELIAVCEEGLRTEKNPRRLHIQRREQYYEFMKSDFKRDLAYTTVLYDEATKEMKCTKEELAEAHNNDPTQHGRLYFIQEEIAKYRTKIDKLEKLIIFYGNLIQMTDEFMRITELNLQEKTN